MRQQIQTLTDELAAARQTCDALRAQLEAAQLEARKARAEADKLRVIQSQPARRVKK